MSSQQLRITLAGREHVTEAGTTAGAAFGEVSGSSPDVIAARVNGELRDLAHVLADGLDFLAGMGPENVTEFGLAVRGADALTPYLEKEAVALRQVTGDQVAAALGGLISSADAEVLTGEFAAEMAASLRASVREGIAGWRDDDLAFTADWGFSLDALDGRAAIWQGDQDRMVPYAHGQWLAAHIPGARVHLEPGAGHVTMVVTAIDRILDDLLDLAGLPR